MAPATNDRGPRYMERALAAIHQANHDRLPITLEYGITEGRIGMFVQVPYSIREIVTGPIIANYPNCSISAVEPEEGNAADEIWSAELNLEPELFPILRHAQFEDSLNGSFGRKGTPMIRRSKLDKP